MAEEIITEERVEQLSSDKNLPLPETSAKSGGAGSKKSLLIDKMILEEGAGISSTNTEKKKPEKTKASIEPPDKKVIALPEKKKRKRGSVRETKKNTDALQKTAPHHVSKIAFIQFALKFHTTTGQSLFITGNHEMLGYNDSSKAMPMEYFSEGFWIAEVKLDTQTIPAQGIVYNYLLKNEDGTMTFDWGGDKVIYAGTVKKEKVFIIDSWNHTGFYENAFYTEPFKNVLLKNNFTPVKIVNPKTYTHIFKVKAPLLAKGETLCICGNTYELGSWKTEKARLLSREKNEDFFSIKFNLSKSSFPVVYKYGVYNVEENKFMNYESGNNRVLYDSVEKNKTTIINDGFAVLRDNTWKGAGVAIPVFSLRSKNSCGTGEFADLKLLIDWAKLVGLKLVQILPVNDTTATHSWSDSYPYAAISAFALHPMYLHLEKIVDDKNKALFNEINEEKNKLNKRDSLDYEAVNNFKWKIIKALYPLQQKETFASPGYKKYFEKNKHWLVPYAAFCYLRDKYHTAEFSLWPSHKKYSSAETGTFFDTFFKDYDEVAIHLFIQYHLHLQLREATEYAHSHGIIMKGDIPIGIYRNGADAWQHPELFHMDMQAGAPPDDFVVTGQNWGFPTYNWEVMKQDGFAWWKQRFEQMEDYFDAFRIDHILGFFRIWSIPVRSVEGIMGHFEPSLAVHTNEFNEKNIWFDYHRYCSPFINDRIIWDTFRENQTEVKKTFLDDDGPDNYKLKPAFSTQRQVENYFAELEDNDHNNLLKQKLFSLISNVILFEAEGSQGQQFHFRFGMESTSSFQNLEYGTQQQLRGLYINYFFRRQDNFWMQQAMQKLPALKRVTNMLVCGEDLGLVPGCVPEVMKQLGLLSLEIQRMPKDSSHEFFHPNDAPYLSVVTPSTHDMSTIRGWWEEDRNKTQRFYNFELGQWGDAPHFCEAWINKAILIQHLYSPAIWGIFQLQDLLGIDKNIRRENPHEERINIPANAKHYWKYRMHMDLEDLITADDYNLQLSDCIKSAGR